MLTFSQIRTDAFMEEGDYEMYCERCAAEKWGALFIARLEAGLEEPVIEMSGPAGMSSYSPSPYPDARVRTVSGYEMGEHESQEAWNTAESAADDNGYVQERTVPTGDPAPWEEYDSAENLTAEDGSAVTKYTRTLTETEAIYYAMEEDGATAIECAGSCGRVYTGGAQPWQERNADGSIPKYIRSADDSRWTGI